MTHIDKYIYAKYKNTDFYSYGGFKKVIECKESKLYDKIDLYDVYILIVNYQIKTYGCSLCDAYKNQHDKESGQYLNNCSKFRKYYRLRKEV